MAVIVRIPTPLRNLTGGAEEVTCAGKTIREIIENLESQFGGIKDRICDENGDVRRFVNIYLNEEDIRFLQNLDTEVGDTSEISIVPAIAGGTESVRKVYLTYPETLVREPVIYNVGQKFKVVTNIRTASVGEGLGLVAMEMTGSEQELDRALAYIEGLGIKVEPIEKAVVEG